MKIKAIIQPILGMVLQSETELNCGRVVSPDAQRVFPGDSSRPSNLKITQSKQATAYDRWGAPTSAESERARPRARLRA